MRDNEGFAKLRGHNVEFFIQKLSVTLGRTMPFSKEKMDKKIHQLDRKELLTFTNGGGSNKRYIDDEKSQQLRLLLQEQEVDVPLGPYKNISRFHARISYNFNGKFFELLVLSKNGVKVDGRYYGRDSGPVRLRNGSEVLIGDSYFVFQLPTANNSASSGSPASASSASMTSEHAAAVGGQKTGVASKIMQQQQQINMQKKNVIHAKPIKTNPSVSMDKPNVSYATMIAQALASTTNRTLSLQQIYQWISDTYPYYTQAEVGWKSSVRHNLSHSKFFHKVPQEETESNQRGIYTLNPEYEEDLLQGLTGRKLKNRIKEKEGADATPTTTSASSSPSVPSSPSTPRIQSTTATATAVAAAAGKTSKKSATKRKLVKKESDDPAAKKQKSITTPAAAPTTPTTTTVIAPQSIQQAIQPGMAFANMFPFALGAVPAMTQAPIDPSTIAGIPFSPNALSQFQLTLPPAQLASPHQQQQQQSPPLQPQPGGNIQQQ